MDDDELDGILDGALEAFEQPQQPKHGNNALESRGVDEAEEAPEDGLPKPPIPEETAAPVVDHETDRALEDALKALGELGLGQGDDGGGNDVSEADMKLVEEFMTSLTSSLGNFDVDKAGGNGPGPASAAGGANGARPEVETLVDSIVGHLLSEDVLKTPMLQMRSAYAKWLPANAESLSAEKLGRYSRQQELVEQICDKYESKAESSEIMELLSKMQETGAPPEEIMKELEPASGSGLPAVQAAELDKFASQCGMQ